MKGVRGGGGADEDVVIISDKEDVGGVAASAAAPHRPVQLGGDSAICLSAPTLAQPRCQLERTKSSPLVTAGMHLPLGGGGAAAVAAAAAAAAAAAGPTPTCTGELGFY